MNKIKDFPVLPEQKEIDHLKNLMARQDDLIAQLKDDLKAAQIKTGELGQECEEMEDKIESYREIIKTIMEITE